MLPVVRSCSTRESEEAVLTDLKWLGIHWDEGAAERGRGMIVGGGMHNRQGVITCSLL